MAQESIKVKLNSSSLIKSGMPESENKITKMKTKLNYKPLYYKYNELKPKYKSNLKQQLYNKYLKPHGSPNTKTFDPHASMNSQISEKHQEPRQTKPKINSFKGSVQTGTALSLFNRHRCEYAI